MRKSLLVGLLLLSILGLSASAQDAVRIGRHEFVPKTKTARTRSGRTRIVMGAATNGQRNVLLQLDKLPSANQQAQMKARGILLDGYINANAYLATVRADVVNPSSVIPAGLKLKAVMPLEPRLRLAPEVEYWQVPAWAKGRGETARILVNYAVNASPADVLKSIQNCRVSDVEVYKGLHIALVQARKEAVFRIAELPFVYSINFVAPPLALQNYTGRLLSRANVLNLPTSLGGRGLTGKGMVVGIWDTSPRSHPDFNSRVHRMETDDSHDHGTHVTGTVLGDGFQDPDARGMAPEAEAYTYNFNTGSNGLKETEEMFKAFKEHHITVTQNSYGYNLNCKYMDEYTYKDASALVDRLSIGAPTVTHVYAAGNDRDLCRAETVDRWGVEGYGTSTRRAKNIIAVGALDDKGELAFFSSCGPQDDGRLFPTVCAKGVKVYSTMPGGNYSDMSGTSMACPTASGSFLLVKQRYEQLHNGHDMRGDLSRALAANTATDDGRPHPDFQYGFGVLDVEKAVMAVENNQYDVAELQQGGANYTKQIEIPEDATELRVLITWDDPVPNHILAYGDKALVNDLDLSVVATGASVSPALPWVCNPAKGHVEDIATRQEDHLNNIEQVTLSKEELSGARRATITVSPTAIPGGDGKQTFALTWWFERGNTPKLRYPLGGELLSPGSPLMIQVDNATSPFDVYISYDGMKTFKLVREDAKVNPETYADGRIIATSVPEDAPITNEAYVQLRDKAGHVVNNAVPFIIAPQIANFKVAGGDCDKREWKLTWKYNSQAQKGYYVLLGDPSQKESKDKWKIIGTVASKWNDKFTVTPDMVKGVDDPYFSIACKTGEGTWGKRTVAIRPGCSTPVTLTTKNLPFEEFFVRYPSPYLLISLGKGGGENEPIKLMYTDKKAHKTVGANIMYIESSYMDGGKFHPVDAMWKEDWPNLCTLTMCEVDLRAFDPADEIFLTLYGALDTWLQKDEEKDKVGLRVLSNGTLLEATDGKTVHNAVWSESGGTRTVYSREFVYRLRGGKKHKLQFQFSALEKKAKFFFEGYTIKHLPSTPDIQVSWRVKAEDAPMTEPTKVQYAVLNTSGKELRDIDVSYTVNGQLQGGKKIKRIGPGEEVYVDATLDLTTKLMGEFMDVRIAAKLKNDPTPGNNVIEQRVYSMGDILRYEMSQFVFTPFGPMNVDPLTNITLERKRTFTDFGGFLQNYPEGQSATMKIYPKKKSNRIRITFHQIELYDDGTDEQRSHLKVYTEQTSKIQGMPLDYNTPKMDIIGKPDLSNGPLVFTSESPDGGIAMLFTSMDSVASGWVADVEELEGQNILTLIDATVATNLYDAAPTAQVPVRVKIRNNWKSDQRNVRVSFVVTDDGKPIKYSYTIPEIKGDSEQWYDLDPIELHYGPNRRTAVFLSCDGDFDISDNEQHIEVVCDKFCPKCSYPDRKSNPLKLGRPSKWDTYDDVIFGQEEISTASLDGRNITLYKNPTNSLSTSFQWKGNGKECTLLICIDWNDDNFFGPGEIITTKTSENNCKPVIEYGGKPVGKHRARLVFATSELNPSPCMEGPLPLGGMWDFFVDNTGEWYEMYHDMRVEKLEAGPSGQSLSDQQEVRFNVTYYDKNRYTGDIIAKLFLDGSKVATETFSVNDIGKYASSYQQLAFTQKIDVTPVGTHTVRVQVDFDGDVNTGNNSQTVEVVSTSTDESKLYTLSLRNSETESENLDLSNFDDNLYYSFVPAPKSMIFWMKVQKPKKTVDIFASDDGPVRLSVAYGDGGDFPDNSLVLRGEGVVAHTKGDLLTYDKWTHVAIALLPAPGGVLLPQLFIDGQEVKLTIKGEGGKFSFRKLHLAKSATAAFKFFSILKAPVNEFMLPMILASQPTASMSKFYMANLQMYQPPKNTYAWGNARKKDNDAEEFTAVAKINASPERIASTTDGVWKEETELLYGFDFGWSATVESVKNTALNEWTIRFAEGTNLASITGKVIPQWCVAKVSPSSGTPATAFVDGKIKDLTQPIQLKVDMVLQGFPYSQTVTVKGIVNTHPLPQLLSMDLESAKNTTWLKGDVSLRDAAPSPDVFTLSATIPTEKIQTWNLSAVVPSFTLSAGATATIDGTPVESGITSVDLTQPRLMVVTNAVGKQTSYVLDIRLEDKVTWTLDPNTIEYGGAPLTVSAVSASGAPVEFRSAEPSTAIIVKDKLYPVTPGKTKIYAYVGGSENIQAKGAVTQELLVRKRKLLVSPRIHLAYGSPIVWGFDYQGLVRDRDTLDLPREDMMAAYQLIDAEGNMHTLSEVLPMGVYALKVKPKEMYPANPLYEVTLQDGTLTVSQGAEYTFSLTVVDAADNPLENAEVILDGRIQLTGEEGKCVWVLPKGQVYPYSIALDTYAQLDGVVDLGEGNITRKVTLSKPEFTLTYLPGEHGEISGASTQYVARGYDATQVIATPEFGYTFSQWSDGVKDNPRQDTDVQKSAEVTAEYTPITCTISYATMGGGKLAEGVEASVTKQFGMPIAAVTARPVDPSYYFMFWDDGVLTQTRPATKIDGSKTVTAHFAKYETLPYRQDFEQGFANGWGAIQMGEDPANWRIVEDHPGVMGQKGKGVLIDCPLSTQRLVNLWSFLYAPAFKLENTDKPIHIFYDWADINSWHGVFIHYRTNLNGEWNEVRGEMIEHTFGSKRNGQHTALDASKFAGAQWVQFRFQYKGDGANDFAYFDNIGFTQADQEQEYAISFVAEPSSGGEVVDYEGTAITSKSVKIGDALPTVTAKPKPGYHFVQWRDGSIQSRRNNLPYCFEEKTYTAIFEPDDKITLTYRPSEPGTGHFLIDGVKVDSQSITSGEQTKEVIAVPEEGYDFVLWVTDGVETASRPPYAATESRQLVARFSKRKYPFAVKVLAQGQPLVGAMVSIENDAEATGADGIATAHIIKGSYGISVAAPGYKSMSDRIEVTGDAVKDLFEFNLDYGQCLAFDVFYQGDPLAGATLSVGSHTAKTNSQGHVEMLLPVGVHDYAIAHAGYSTLSGKVNLRPNISERQTVSLQTPDQYTIAYESTGGVVYSVMNGAVGIPTNTQVQDGTPIVLTIPKAELPRLQAFSINGQDAMSLLMGGVYETVVHGSLSFKAEFSAPMRTCVFSVTNPSGEPIPSAKLRIGKEWYTLLDGTLSIDLPEGEYNLEARALGMEAKQGNLTVGATTISKAIQLAPLAQQITFKVVRGAAKMPISNCMLKVGEFTLETSEAGIAVFGIPDGVYSCMAVDAQQHVVTKKVTVDGATSMSYEIEFPELYPVVVTADNDATISLANAEGETLEAPLSVEAGSSLTLSVAPTSLQRMLDLTINTVSIKDKLTDGKFLIENISEAQTIEGTFKPTFTVAIKADNNARIIVHHMIGTRQEIVTNGDPIAQDDKVVISLSEDDLARMKKLQVIVDGTPTNLTAQLRQSGKAEVTITGDTQIVGEFDPHYSVSWTSDPIGAEITMTVVQTGRTLENQQLVIFNQEVKMTLPEAWARRFVSCEYTNGLTSGKVTNYLTGEGVSFKIEGDFSMHITFNPTYPVSIDSKGTSLVAMIGANPLTSGMELVRGEVVELFISEADYNALKGIKVNDVDKKAAFAKNALGLYALKLPKAQSELTVEAVPYNPFVTLEISGVNEAFVTIAAGGKTLTNGAEKVESETPVTLTLTEEGKAKIRSLTLDGVDRLAALQDGVFTFTLTADAKLELAFNAEETPTDRPVLTLAEGLDRYVEVSANGTPITELSSTLDANTEVILSLTEEGKAKLASLTVGAEDVLAKFVENRYSFTIAENTAIAFTLKAEQKVKLILEGNLTSYVTVLVASKPVTAPEMELTVGTEVMLMVPEAVRVNLSKLTVGGADILSKIQNGMYTFTLTEDTKIAAQVKLTKPEPNPTLVESELLSQVQVFPNPTRGLLSLQNAEHVELIYLYTSAGQLVQHLRVGVEETGLLDLRNLPSGIYILRLQAADGIRLLRVVKI